MMGSSSVFVAAVLLLLYVPVIISARHISQSHSRYGHSDLKLANTKDGSKVGNQSFFDWERRPTKEGTREPKTLHVAGSRLPDCSHACGSCTPCKLVMVGFVCASIEEAETCPMAYKCMCHNKSYPVP